MKSQIIFLEIIILNILWKNDVALTSELHNIESDNVLINDNDVSANIDAKL